MFFIECNGEQKTWFNKKEDDFLRYVPKAFNASKDDLKIYLVPDEIVAWSRGNPNRFLSFPKDSGKVQKVQIIKDAEGKETTKNAGSAIKLIEVEWPYDENMNFLGIK